MRICLLSSRPVGDDSRIARGARALAEAGHDVAIFEGRASGTRPVTALPGPLGAALAWVLTVVGAARLRPQVVQACGRRTLVRAFLAARLARANLVYQAGDVAHRRGPTWRERRLVPRCTGVLAASRTAAAALQARHGLHAQPTVVRDAPVVPAGGLPSAGLRSRLGAHDVRLLLSDAEAGGATTETLISTFGSVEGTQLALLCHPEDADALRLVAEREMVAGRVHFMRPVLPQRLLAFAAEADVALALAPNGGVESQALRYLAAGAPLVAADVPEVGELVDGDDAAWLVEPGDRDALVAAIGDALAAGGSTPRPVAPQWPGESQRLLAFYDQLPARIDRGAPQRSGRRRLIRPRAVLAGARELATRTTTREPRAAALYARGRRLRSQGQYEDAAQAFRESLAIDDAYAACWLHLGHALHDAGHREDAIAAFRRAVELDEDPAADLVVDAAVALARAGAKQDARAVLDELERQEGKPVEAWAGLARLSVALGDMAISLDAVRELERAEVQTPAIRTVRQRVLEQAGEPTGALEMARTLGDGDGSRRIEGTLRALDPDWKPSVPTVAWDGPRSDAVVLHLLETALPYVASGYAYRTKTVHAAQRRAGLEPVAATRLGFPANRRIRDFAPLEEVDGVIHHYLTLPGVVRYTSIPIDEQLTQNVEMLARLIERVRPAVLHATSPHFNGLLGLSLREAFGIPLVYEARGFPEMTWAVRPGGDRTEVYRLRRAAEARCMREADAVITLSEVMKEQIVGRGVPGERVFVVPHMVDTNAFAARPKDDELVRSYGLEDKVVVGYLSSLVEYEGVDVLLRGIAALRRRAPNVVCLIVGDGLSMPSLRRLATELDIDDVVRFTGRVPHDQAAAHYSLIDLFVVPRRGIEVSKYVSPLKPFEALAMERCLVVSDLPALSEAIGHGEHGRLFTPDDPDSLADVLEPLIADEDLRRALGRSGRQHIVANHSFEMPSEVAAAPLAAARGSVV